MFVLTEDFKRLKTRVRCLECLPFHSITEDDIINWNSGGASGVGYTGTVNQYDDLPDATIAPGQYYYVLNSQGTRWLPGVLGGIYYPAGTYYSTGVAWITDVNPWQASQSDVDAGLISDQFVSPMTLANALQWDTKANAVNFATITVGVAAPSSPGLNDLWVDTT